MLTFVTTGSVCDMIQDFLLPDSIYSEQIDLEKVSQAIKADESECVEILSYPTLEKLIKTAFTSAVSLNKSFALGLTELSFSKPNLDFDALATFYTIIASLNTLQPTKLILQSTLSLLKRPKITIKAPQDIYFLLIIFENPVLKSAFIYNESINADQNESIESLAYQILERTVSILAHSPQICRHYLLNWISRYPVAQFYYKVELINALILYRLVEYYRDPIKKRRYKKCFEQLFKPLNLSSQRQGLYKKVRLSPQVASNFNTSLASSLFLTESANTASSDSASASALVGSTPKSLSAKVEIASYGNDWKLVAFARLQALFFNANIITEKISVSVFYNIMVDYIDIKADFNVWEATGVSNTSTEFIQITKTGALSSFQQEFSFSSPTIQLDSENPVLNNTFTFCQYPFLLSIGQKTQVFEYDAHRLMKLKAHEAFSIAIKNKTVSRPYLHIIVRRSHILQDSFDFLASHETELEKGIRVQFAGEAGVDVGGLRKEWFLLLVRELFDSSKKFFVEDEESKYCWFNMSTQKPIKFYRLTGIVLGLALYNSTILDISFPPVLFKRLLEKKYNLKDFTMLRPTVGASLKKLLEYKDDNFEDVFGLSFAVTKTNDSEIPVDVELTPNGLNTPVTKANRRAYVNKVIEYYLETEIDLAFQALKSGFYTVFEHNAITLFQPCEIENLLRGSTEPINVTALRAVTRYKCWGYYHVDVDNALVIRWFWQHFAALEPEKQRSLLMFVTGSDRIPATGISTMLFTITRLGGDSDRLPVSHTCFNELCLYEYKTKQKFIEKLTMAVEESQGFGLK
jgi:E3 ubiquitin-protein ligase HECTD2